MTTRTGSGLTSRSLGREQEGVVRLPALVHVELEFRMLGLELREHMLERRRILAGQQRQQPAWLSEQPLEHDAHDLVERLAARHRLPLCEPEPLALLHGDAVQLDVA